MVSNGINVRDSESLVELLQRLASELISAGSPGELFNRAFRIISDYVECDLAAAAMLEQNVHLFITRRKSLEMDEAWFGEVMRGVMERRLPFAPAEAIIAADQTGLAGEASREPPKHEISIPLSIDAQILGVLIFVKGGDPFSDEDGRRLDVIAPLLSMAVLALRSRDQVQQLADTDDLTGSWNKRSFRRQLNSEVDRSKVYKLPLSLLMIDVDDFKDVNDEYGHVLGDVLL